MKKNLRIIIIIIIVSRKYYKCTKCNGGPNKSKNFRVEKDMKMEGYLGAMYFSLI